MAEGEVRYCTTVDGVRIAYSAEGEGPPLLFPPIFVGSFALHHLAPSMQAIGRQIRADRQFILYDLRGTGLSQRDVADVSLETAVLDTEAVVNAVGSNRVSVWGASFGGPRAIAFAATHPDRVERLVLSSTFVRISDVLSSEILRSFAQLARANWEVASRVFADMAVRRRDEREGLDWARWFRESISGEMMARLVESHATLDVSDQLPRLRCPTLIVAELTGSLYPFAGAQYLAQTIPAATLLPLETQSDITGLVPEAVSAIIDFLNDAPRARLRPATVTAEPGFQTILFTDVVENTALLRRIGDDAWRAVMREHEEIVRAALKAHGGREISTSGDGFFASFRSSVRALQCAVEIQRTLAMRNETAGHPVEVRIGLNAGEPIEEGEEVLGTAVTMAARIMSQAGAGEILVSDVVRQLVGGKGFLFADRGDYVAKGFEEPVRVYEVRWRE
jgi:class 3 adenylate cyclase